MCRNWIVEEAFRHATPDASLIQTCAAIDAVVGTAAGGIRKHRTQQAAAAQRQSNQQQMSQQLATFNRAVGHV
jgi:hypothetical protein